MVKVIGCGTLQQYSADIMMSQHSSCLGEILNALSIPDSVRPSVVAVRNGQVIRPLDEVFDGDVIELFVLLSGG